MGFISGFFSDLNSSKSRKSFILAVVLGVTAGFMPSFNIFTAVIILSVLIFRIPVVIFVLSWILSGMIGNFLDPVFAKIGYEALTLPWLVPLWETLYNIKIFRLTGFNNTVLMGSFIVSAVFGAVLYFISVYLSNKLKGLNEKLSASIYTSWMLPKQKNSLFRKSGLIAVVAVISTISVFLLFFMDPILKTVLEKGISKITGRNVSIDKVKSTLSLPGIEISGIKIGDIGIDKITLQSRWKYLLWKKADIKNLEIINIHSSKEILSFVNKKTCSKKGHENEKVYFSIPKPDHVLKAYTLDSLEKVKELKCDYEEFVVKLNRLKKDSIEIKKELQECKKEAELLKKQAKHIKSLKDLKAVLSKAKELDKKLSDISKKINEDKKTYTLLKNKISNDLKDIKTASKEDYDKLSKKYDMLKNKEYYEFVESFLKPEVARESEKLRKLFSYIKPYLSSGKDKNIQTLRAEGRYIYYKDNTKYPDFTLERMTLDAHMKDVNFTVKAKDLSSNQKLLGKKGYLNVLSGSNYYKKAFLDAEYTKNIKLKYGIDTLYLKSINLNGVVLKDSDVNIKGKGSVENYFEFDNQITVKPGSTVSKNKILSLALKRIKVFNVTVTIKGDTKKTDIKIKSDLDKIISKYIRKTIAEEIEKNKKILKQKIEQKINDEIKKTGFNYNTFNNKYPLENLNDSVAQMKKVIKELSEKKLKNILLKNSASKYLKF